MARRARGGPDDVELKQIPIDEGRDRRREAGGWHAADRITGCLTDAVGIGLPDGFDIDQPRTSLGFKVITGLVRQLQGHLTVTSNDPKGAHFLLDLPILHKTQTSNSKRRPQTDSKRVSVK